MMPHVIDIVLFCPKCNTQHIDVPTATWSNPPHKTHLCQTPDCGHLWRPSDHPTNGVERTKSGKDADVRPSGVSGFEFAKSKGLNRPAPQRSP